MPHPLPPARKLSTIHPQALGRDVDHKNVSGKKYFLKKDPVRLEAHPPLG
jgi:hypothetical protein